MNIFSNLFGQLKANLTEYKKGGKIGLFGSTEEERNAFFVTFGEVAFINDYIEISNYPFKPASIYPSKKIRAENISDISIISSPLTLRLNNELIFISATLKNDLCKYANDNTIKIVERTFNWDFILDPFLDTEFSNEDEKRTTNYLLKNGITVEEITEIRTLVKDQMMKYNFDTVLWEWVSLGLSDVLQAMRPKLDESNFYDFYWKAMDIALRGCNQ